MIMNPERKREKAHIQNRVLLLANVRLFGCCESFFIQPMHIFDCERIDNQFGRRARFEYTAHVCG